MGSRELVHKLYFKMQYRKKTHEQLQIGKIKFEVIPVYVNDTCIHSIFKPKYTQAITSNSNLQTNKTFLIKILLSILSLFGTYILLHTILINLGILVETNDTFISVISPYIFSDLPSHYTPHLSVLLKNLNLLTP